MENNIKNNTSYICLVSLFFIGNAVINLPFKENSLGSIPGFLIAFFVSLPLNFLFSKMSFEPKKTPFGITATIIFTVYALFCGIVTLRNYVTFSDRIILPEIGSFFPTLVFLLLLWLICREKETVLLKLSLISAVAVFFCVVLLFLLSLDDMSIKEIIPKRMPTLKEIGYQSLAYFAMSFVEGIVLVCFLKGESKKALTSGFLFGSALIFLTLIQAVALFGYNSLSQLNNPYSSAISTLTFGDKFSRMEGFSYLLYFSCTLTKTAVCIKTGRTALCTLFPNIKKYFIPAVLLIYGIMCVFTNIFINIGFLKIAPYLIVPALILILLFKINRSSIR